MAWTREELDEALRALDRDLAPMIASGADATQVWSTFNREASRIEQGADRHFWYAAARLNRLLVDHQLLPRVRAMQSGRRRPAPVQQRA